MDRFGKKPPKPGAGETEPKSLLEGGKVALIPRHFNELGAKALKMAKSAGGMLVQSLVFGSDEIKGSDSEPYIANGLY